MKRNEFFPSALFFGLMAVAPPALALDTAEILQVARNSVIVTFLENSCNLSPGPEVEERDRKKFLRISETRNTQGDTTWTEFTEEIDKAAVEYAALNVKLSKEEFCRRLQDDFLSTGGTLVEKE